MGRWCSAVGARVEQGRQCGMFGRIGRRHGPRALAAIISERGRGGCLLSRTSIQTDHVMCSLPLIHARVVRPDHSVTTPIRRLRYNHPLDTNITTSTDQCHQCAIESQWNPKCKVQSAKIDRKNLLGRVRCSIQNSLRAPRRPRNSRRGTRRRCAKFFE